MRFKAFLALGRYIYSSRPNLLQSWEFAKNNLKETFDVLEDIYNIQDLEKGLFKKI